MKYWLIAFILSRLVVLAYPPYVERNSLTGVDGHGYSDVHQDYERYANMWHYGLTPYLEHLYEYPPAAILFTYLPLWIDLQGIGHYYQNYRIQIFLWETLFFVLLLTFISKSSIPLLTKQLSLGFYIVAGLVAKDFWYDGLDLVFIMSLSTAVMFRYLVGHQTIFQKTVFWALFWFSVAVKLLTLPLILPLMALSIKRWRQEFIALILGFLLVWGVPLLLFRSSLAVFLVFHGERPLKYEAFGSFIIRTINDFTHTEIQSDIKPHFPMIGPVSGLVEKTTSLVFVVAVMTVLIAYSVRFIKQVEMKTLVRILTVILMYEFTLFLSSKILSRPFHIWYVPFITLFPFKSNRQQLIAFGLALTMLALDTTPYIHFPKGYIGWLAYDRIRDLCRFVPMMIFLFSIPKWKANTT